MNPARLKEVRESRGWRYTVSLRPLALQDKRIVALYPSDDPAGLLVVEVDGPAISRD